MVLLCCTLLRVAFFYLLIAFARLPLLFGFLSFELLFPCKFGFFLIIEFLVEMLKDFTPVVAVVVDAVGQDLCLLRVHFEPHLGAFIFEYAHHPRELILTFGDDK